MAKQYWLSHVDQLVENELLNKSTVDSFATHCDLYARLRTFDDLPTSRTFLDTLKAFQSSSKVFRLVPCEKPNVKESRFKDYAEVNLG